MGMKSLRPFEALYPVPMALITTMDEKGESNVMTVAWIGVVCSDPPEISVSIRPGRHSHPMLVQRGEFVASIPSLDLVRAVDFCGWSSGKNVDKFEKMGLTRVPATKVAPPLIAECPVNIECVVRHTLHLGVHDMFVGEVVAVHADEKILNEKGSIDYARANPLVYLGGEYWKLGEKVGYHGFTAKELKDKSV
jgi:flavin reductase (DIM6/NTAB) family NADH-FMN oxidoreductase RutF